MPLPSNKSLYAAMEVASNPESARYFRDRFIERLEKEKMLDRSKAVVAEVKKFAEYVEYKQKSSGGPWGGVLLPSEFKNFQRNLAASAVGNIKERDILFDFAINENSELLRGYSSGGKALDELTNAELDKLFNAWLAENNMISKGGVIYEADEAGEIKYDKAGNPQKADPDELKQKVHDKSSGFKRFVHERDEDVELNVREHAYPKEKAPEAEAPTRETEPGMSQS